MLKAMLRKFVNKEGHDWDIMLSYVLFAYGEVPQSTTGFSSFELLYGREMRGPLDILKEEWEADKKSDESVLSYVLLVRKRMEQVSDLVSETLKVAQQCKKTWYDQCAKERRCWCCFLPVAISYWLIGKGHTTCCVG